MLVVYYLMNMKSKIEKSKKGQAALEYLVTYGWALVLILGIVALLYSYIFKPEFYVVESCSMAPGISCSYFYLANVGNNMLLNFTMTNEMDFAMEIQEINITTENFLGAGETVYNWYRVGGGLDVCTPDCTASLSQTAVAERGDFSANFQFNSAGKQVPRPATLQRMKFSMVYRIPSTGSVHRTAGILNVKVS